MLLVQMQKKSIIIFYFFKVQLCRAENEPAITDEANALLIIDPDVAWVLFSMRVCQEMQATYRTGEAANEKAVGVTYCHPQLSVQLFRAAPCSALWADSRGGNICL